MQKVISFEELAKLEQIAMATAALPFGQRLLAFMDYRKWNPHRFTLRTNLDAVYYSRLKNGRRNKLDMRTAVAIFIGLRLPLPIAESLLQSAGMAFSRSKKDQAYRYLVMMMNGADIDECNAFLGQQGVPLLGSIARDERLSA